jgi:hypothetical protein
MGWFSRKQKTSEADPVGELCRLLVERPWEWEDATRAEIAVLTHVSGASVAWRAKYPFGGDDYDVFLSPKAGAVAILRRDVARVMAALRASAVARVKSGGGRPFSVEAQAMARAVLAGDMGAASALADVIRDLCGVQPD